MLDQYKQLNDEAEESLTYGRRMESRVSQLNLELRSKSHELQAAQLRLTHMEQDLVEMSAANDNYKSQILNLSTRVDIAESEMRVLRTESLNPDVHEVQRLNEELIQQKDELQHQIAIQAGEIENLQRETRELREELEQVNQALEQQDKQPNFQSDFH